MRELKVIGLDVDGKAHHLRRSRPDRQVHLASATTGCAPPCAAIGPLGQTLRDIEVKGVLRPKDIQARIRAGASVEQVAESSGMDITKVERFAHPVLLERPRAAELATAAHPVLADGPAVLTLLETISSRADRPRPELRGHDLGRLAQRGRPLDRADGLAGRACPTTSRTSASPPARTAAPSPPSTTPPAN